MEHTDSISPAGFGRRSAAAFIDLVILLGLVAAAFVPLSLTRDVDDFLAYVDGGSFNEMAVSRFESTSFLLTVGVVVAYVGAGWIFGHGQTIGKRVMGIRVVRGA
jgi:uncharacterized RDD family membrane protein YckC